MNLLVSGASGLVGSRLCALLAARERALPSTGGVLVTGSIYLVHIPAFWLHATITAALAGAMARTSIDVLVHNAGVMGRPYSAADVMAINAHAPIAVTEALLQQALDAMK